MIGDEHPQKVKHHLFKLQDEGYVTINEDEEEVRVVVNDTAQLTLYQIPIYGAATCGSPTISAEDVVEGYLKVSERVLPTKDVHTIIALQCIGNSMNRAKISGLSIDEGDYVLVNTRDQFPSPGDYIATTIEGCGSIKKYHFDAASGQVHLLSESTDYHPPIILDPEDNVQLIGKVVCVIKNRSQD